MSILGPIYFEKVWILRKLGYCMSQPIRFGHRVMHNVIGCGGGWGRGGFNQSVSTIEEYKGAQPATGNVRECKETQSGAYP